MDNNNQNMGSFGAPLGDSQALQEAMRRRNIDPSVLNQVSSSAAGPQPPIPPDIPQGAPNVGPTPAQALTEPQQSQEDGFRSKESEIALKAMKSVIDTDNKIAQQALGLSNNLGALR